MQANIIKKISPIVRIIVSIILILCLLMAKSLYLILFITTFIIILLVVTDKKVKLYVNIAKKIIIILLFILFIYIIIMGKYQLLEILLLVHKTILVTLILAILLANTTFKELHEALYMFLSIFKKNNQISQFTLDLTLTFYFIKTLIFSSEEIKDRQVVNGKNKKSIKHFIIPIFIYSVNKLNEFQEKLKISFYEINYSKVNLKSKIVLTLFLLIFIVCIFKEVIL